MLSFCLTYYLIALGIKPTKPGSAALRKFMKTMKERKETKWQAFASVTLPLCVEFLII